MRAENNPTTSLAHRVFRRASVDTIDLVSRKLHQFPFEARVGIKGIEGARPKTVISDKLDITRMFFMVDEIPFAKDMIQTLKKDPENACFVDAGAAAGAYTLLASQVLRNSTVVAVEPDPDSFEKLLRNIRVNKFRNKVIAVNTALEDEPGEGILFSSGASSYIAPRLRRTEGLANEIKVNIDSIDTLVKDSVIPIPTAVKIDVEGAETMLLRGMSGVLSSSERTRSIFLELHSEEVLRQFDTSRQEVLTLLSSYGFGKVFKQTRGTADLIHFER